MNRGNEFVEAKLILKASDEYPRKPPKLDLKDAKGLDDSRHATLLVSLEAQAKEMAGEPMLVAICDVSFSTFLVSFRHTV
ncbi:hypothetical protein R1sor_000844 [Riccia sorocarpa]|uniref:RWD domain-containing protein n=1 Tax=Riccia sorocarpa TaxID=122646 RepID=A0ABD3GXE7_9MARC